MSYDPTEWVPQTPGQPPAQPPVTPPTYGQAPQLPAPPTPGQVAPTQYAAQPPAYGQPPQQPGQSNPGFPPYGQPPQQPGQSNPGWPPYSQPQQAAYGQSSPTQPSYGVPTEPYGQPAQQPWGAAVPPGYMPPAASPKKSGPKPWVILLIVVLLLVIVGSGGGILYLSTRPKPVITLTSNYHDGTTLVGAASTSLTLTGNDFTSNSAITLLLDGKAIPGAPSPQSDSNGKLSATTLTVTSAWSVGTHTLTAKDASNSTTKAGVKVEIVTPGQANTPGPNGAPTDSANMSIIAIVIADGGSETLNLIVTGSTNGGTVCSDIDDGKSHTQNGISANGVPFTETTVSTCSGTYKGGKLDYTETITTDKVVYDNGLICSATAPYIATHLQGEFTRGTAVNGNYSRNTIAYSCNLGTGSQSIPAITGTWTGVAVVH